MMFNRKLALELSIADKEDSSRYALLEQYCKQALDFSLQFEGLERIKEDIEILENINQNNV